MLFRDAMNSVGIQYLLRMGCICGKESLTINNRRFYIRSRLGEGYSNSFYPFLPGNFEKGSWANSADADQMPLNVASD